MTPVSEGSSNTTSTPVHPVGEPAPKCTGDFFAVARNKQGEVVFSVEERNLVLDSAQEILSRLLTSGDAGAVIDRIGFGTNSTLPQGADTALTDPYYKVVTSATFNAPNQAVFDWTLDYAEAVEDPYKTITEYALVCADGTLFSRKVKGAIEKTEDISLTGQWVINF